LHYDLKKLPDFELLTRYTAGEEAAFREIVDRYKNSLYAFLWKFLNRHDLVEDIFQETFLQLFSSRESFDSDHNQKLYQCETVTSTHNNTFTILYRRGIIYFTETFLQTSSLVIT
jgi:DNA-directed RNA polymerase specialized sigma24 family protein